VSRKARALLSPALDDTSVPVTDQAARWRTLFGSEAPRAAGFIEQAIAWKEQVLVHGDIAPAIAHDLTIAARHAGEARGHRPEAARADAQRSSAALLHGTAEPLDFAAPCSSPGPSQSATAKPRPAAPRSRSTKPPPAPLPPASSQLLPGTRLVKAYGGKTHVVEVTDTGFRYEGETFTSLSAVAKHITGTHWNGLLFFGLRRRKTYPAKGVSHG
jgi:hypothetical protein